jgi:hypothetical protein
MTIAKVQKEIMVEISNIQDLGNGKLLFKKQNHSLQFI